jgi:hypothetical protein
MVVSRVDGRRYLVGVVGDGRNEVVLWNYQADSIEKRLEVDRFTYFSSLQKLYVSDRQGGEEAEGLVYVLRDSEGIKMISVHKDL